MSKRARMRVVAMVAVVPLLSLGFLTSSTSAAPSQQPDPGPTCEYRPEEGGGFYCDANDIAGLLSGLLSPTFGLTCLQGEEDAIVCRVTREDDTSYSG